MSTADEDEIQYDGLSYYQSNRSEGRRWIIYFRVADPKTDYVLMLQDVLTEHGAWPTVQAARAEADRLDNVVAHEMEELSGQFEEEMGEFIERVQRSWNGDPESKQDLLQAVENVEKAWAEYRPKLIAFRGLLTGPAKAGRNDTD